MSNHSCYPVEEFLANSCNFNLIKRIDKKFDSLLEYEQGRIMFLKIALDDMFTMSNMVIMLLQKYLKQFAQGGQMRMFGSAQNSLMQCVSILPRLMLSLRSPLVLFLKGSLVALL
jgi:hypothetical protein